MEGHLEIHYQVDDATNQVKIKQDTEKYKHEQNLVTPITILESGRQPWYSRSSTKKYMPGFIQQHAKSNE